MNNFWTVVIIFMLFTLITQISLSLGLTTTVIEYPTVVDTTGDLDLIGALSYAIVFAINNISAFTKILTFQTALPNFINAILIFPLGAGVFYLLFIMIRGGAS